MRFYVVYKVFFFITNIFSAFLVLPVLPYLLGFAAGAMIYAVISELMPSFSRSESLIGVLSFSAGFCAMMMLDVAFG